MLNKNSNFSALIELLGPYKRKAIVLFFVMVIAAFLDAVGLSLVIPLMGIILGGGAINSDSTLIILFNDFFGQYTEGGSKVIAVSILLGCVFFIKNLFIYLRDILTVSFQYTLRRYWSVSMMKIYLNQRWDKVGHQKKGVLLNNLVTEPMVSSKFVSKLVHYFSKVLVVISVYVLLLLVNWQFTVICTLMVLVFLGIFWKLSKKTVVLAGSKRLALMQKITNDAEQSLNNIKQIKMLLLSDRVSDVFYNKLTALQSIIFKFSLFQKLPKPMGEFVIISILIATLIYVEYYADYTINSILPFLAFSIVSAHKLYQNLSDLVSDKMLFLSYLPSVNLLNKIIYNPNSELNVNEQIKADRSNTVDIDMKRVSFKYGDKNILNEISLKVPANKITAIVGGSGSGKSTLMNILCRLYDDHSGTISVGVHDILSFDINSWRSNIAYASQDNYLFSMTIKENILLGNDSASDSDVKLAAQLSCADMFIKDLKDGYDTVITDGGSNLSEGQRQRIILARAFINPAPFLFLDEATSFLDFEMESLIMKSLTALQKNKTIIVVTHRLASLREMDNIYFLCDGEIVESGTFLQLVSNNSYFNDLLNQSSSK